MGFRVRSGTVRLNDCSSRLISLPPCGARTGLHESLTGYISRLADAHGLTTWGLVTREIAPRFTRPMIDPHWHSDLFGPFGATLNGVASTAEQGVQILSELTCRNDIIAMTLLPFRDVLSPRSSVRKATAWCPRCLSDWRSIGKGIYLPLLWQLDVVTVCPKHSNSILARTCPHCERSGFQLCRRSVPGYCPICQGWLGFQGSPSANDGIGVTDLDRLVAKQIDDLLQQSVQGCCTPSAPVLRHNLVFILNQLFGGSVTSFSRAAQIHHNSLSDIIFGGARPGLDSLLRLSHAGRVQPAKLICGMLSENDFGTPGRRPFVSPFQKRVCRRYDWPEVAEKLRSEVERRSAFPNSLSSLCRPAGLDSGYVASRLKSSAAELVSRYQTATAERRRKREAAEAADLRAMVQVCLSKGIWPSNRTLRLILKVPGSLRSPKMEKLRRQTLAEAITGIAKQTAGLKES